jgi:hypothetical protein
VVHVEVEDVSLYFELELEPIVIGGTSPMAPETSIPSANTTVIPTAILIRRT